MPTRTAVEAIAQAALVRSDPGERTAFLDGACGGDPAFRQEVEAALEALVPFGGSLVHAPADVPAAAAPPAAPPLAFLQPARKPGSLGRLGHYEVEALIGRGGMGLVFKAFDDQLHRTVALKVLAPELAASDEAQRRFVREARAAAGINHENVVAIHAIAADHRPPFIVMQFIEGCALDARLQAGPLPPQEILRIGQEAALGLAAAHAQGLIHRDVKPSNLLLEAGTGRVKITDFGLARAARDASISRTDVIAGTPMYMSPEQAAGRPLDHRTDLFSLGSVLYELCTGRPAFAATETFAAILRVTTEEPRPIRELNPHTPQALCDLIACLHAKEPEDRPPSAQAVADLLGRQRADLAQPTTTTPRPASPPPPVRRRPWRSAVGAVLGLLLLGGGLALWNLGDGEPPRPTVPEPAAPAPPPPLGPFVLPAREGREEQRFATLAAAALAAGRGDTLEVHGDGPHLTAPLDLGDKPLRIRAARGGRPVVQLDPAFHRPPSYLLRTKAALVLEGLEIRILDPSGEAQTILLAQDAPVAVRHCRLAVTTRGKPLEIYNAPRVEVRNTALFGTWPLVVNYPPDGARVALDQAVLFGFQGLAVRSPANRGTVQVVLHDSTVLGNDAIWAQYKPEPLRPDALPATRVEAAGSVFHWGGSFLRVHPPAGDALEREFLGRWTWQGRQNVLAADRPLLEHHGQPVALAGLRGEGRGPRFEGGPVLELAAAERAALPLGAFRLARGSPGQGAGPGGQDLGADVDQVGPGPAYERWRASLDYPTWTKVMDALLRGR